MTRIFKILSYRDDMEVQSPLIYKARNLSYVAIGVTQLVLAFLAFGGRLNFTVPANHGSLEILTDDSFWAGVYLTTGIVTLLGLRFQYIKSLAMALAASTFFFWGGLQLVFGIDTIRPVSLAGPILALCLVPITITLSDAWAVVLWETKLKET